MKYAEILENRDQTLFPCLQRLAEQQKILQYDLDYLSIGWRLLQDSLGMNQSALSLQSQQKRLAESVHREPK